MDVGDIRSKTHLTNAYLLVHLQLRFSSWRGSEGCTDFTGLTTGCFDPDCGCFSDCDSWCLDSLGSFSVCLVFAFECFVPHRKWTTSAGPPCRLLERSITVILLSFWLGATGSCIQAGALPCFWGRNGDMTPLNGWKDDGKVSSSLMSSYVIWCLDSKNRTNSSPLPSSHQRKPRPAAGRRATNMPFEKPSLLLSKRKNGNGRKRVEKGGQRTNAHWLKLHSRMKVRKFANHLQAKCCFFPRALLQFSPHHTTAKATMQAIINFMVELKQILLQLPEGFGVALKVATWRFGRIVSNCLAKLQSWYCMGTSCEARQAQRKEHVCDASVFKKVRALWSLRIPLVSTSQFDIEALTPWSHQTLDIKCICGCQNSWLSLHTICLNMPQDLTCHWNQVVPPWI